MFDYSGCIHMHSEYSFDGLRTPEEIISSANSCGLDYIIITDHFSLEAKKYEGWHRNTLLIAGEEISPNKNHYLAFNIDKAVIADRTESNPQNYIDDVNRAGGFGFIAHPDHIGNRKFGVNPYTWINWDITGYSGFSVWDLQTDWQETLKGPLTAVMSYLFPAYFLKGPKKETLERWDKINIGAEQLKYGIGEIDNHEAVKKYFKFIKAKIFPFDVAFRTIRTHILLEEPLSRKKEDIGRVLEALRSGSSYISNDYFADPKGGFVFKVSKGKVSVRVPRRALIKIIKDGKKIIEKISDGIEISGAEKGIYRCEIFLKKYFYHPWIFSNPIRMD